YIDGSETIVYPDYTYLTLGYLISISGVDKLLNQNPLQKIVALDEYFPIMYDKNPRLDWSNSFEPRNLKAFSAEPLLIEPTHYVGDKEYFSDTEP
uniref:hypothetical protein n=1 Tax=Salmonella sp. s51228 TaxID=3159652 RepID=UPI00398140E0